MSEVRPPPDSASSRFRSRGTVFALASGGLRMAERVAEIYITPADSRCFRIKLDACLEK